MSNNKWDRPNNPPAPLFFNKKERDLVKQVNDELIERVIGQTILYYPISNVNTNFHPLYGEAINKNFLPPVRVFALVDWSDPGTVSTAAGVDRLSSLTIHFHKRRLTEDQDLYVRVGDFALYGGNYYEITTLSQPKEMFGQIHHKVEISAKCIKARQGLFDGK